MKKKKLYVTPEVEVVIVDSVSLLTASFSETIDTDEVITDPEDIL